MKGKRRAGGLALAARGGGSARPVADGTSAPACVQNAYLTSSSPVAGGKLEQCFCLSLYRSMGSNKPEEAVQHFLPFSPAPLEALTTWAWLVGTEASGWEGDPAGLLGPLGAPWD